jgi:hypothetical protein
VGCLHRGCLAGVDPQPHKAPHPIAGPGAYLLAGESPVILDPVEKSPCLWYISAQKKDRT